MNFLQIFIIRSCRLLFKLVGWLNSEAIFHAYMPPIESVVAISSMLMWHYWSPYLSEREVCFGGSTNWFGTLPTQAWEDFICLNHDPDWNKPFYLISCFLSWDILFGNPNCDLGHSFWLPWLWLDPYLDTIWISYEFWSFTYSFRRSKDKLLKSMIYNVIPLSAYF
jgi:hypothetical protein